MSLYLDRNGLQSRTWPRNPIFLLYFHSASGHLGISRWTPPQGIGWETLLQSYNFKRYAHVCAHKRWCVRSSLIIITLDTPCKSTCSLVGCYIRFQKLLGHSSPKGLTMTNPYPVTVKLVKLFTLYEVRYFFPKLQQTRKIYFTNVFFYLTNSSFGKTSIFSTNLSMNMFVWVLTNLLRFL